MNISRLFASNILWRGAYLFTSMLVTVLMARYLQAYATGWVYYFISWLSFFFLFASASMESSITYFVSSKTINPLRMQSFVLSWTVFVSIVCLTVAAFYFQKGNEFATAPALVWMSLFFITGNILITFFNAFFFSNNDFVTPNLIFIIYNLLLVGLLTAGINGSKLNFFGFGFIHLYFFTFFLQGLTLVIIYRSRQNTFFLFQLPSSPEIKNIITYSGIAFGANLLFFMVTRIDYLFINLFTGNQTGLGNYIQASKLVQLFQLFPGILAATIFPLAAAGYHDKMKEGLLSISRIIFITYFLVCITVALTGKWLFPFLFGPTFNQMYGYFILLMPGLLALASLSLISAYFAAVNKLRINLLGSFTGMLVIVAGDLLFIPRFGIEAAAAVSSIGYIVCFGVAAFFFQKETGENWFSFFKFGKNDLSFLFSIGKNLKNQSSGLTGNEWNK